ncbi:MAG: hypothetical protein L6W00_10295 [Lentisphaeria bacterium]|nr:MAG: hypothetical protein L6W00_10295 [Lentisphaeria bacterium]
MYSAIPAEILSGHIGEIDDRQLVERISDRFEPLSPFRYAASNARMLADPASFRVDLHLLF